MNELIQLLLSSLGDEWLSNLTYRIQASLLRGLYRDPVADLLITHAEEEESHASQLSLHLYSRGISPEIKMPELKIGNNIEEMLKIDLQLELAAVDKYTKILQICEPEASLMDTKMMIESILDQEREHTDEFAALLRTKIESKAVAMKSASFIGLSKTAANKFDELGWIDIANKYDSLMEELIQ